MSDWHVSSVRQKIGDSHYLCEHVYDALSSGMIESIVIEAILCDLKVERRKGSIAEIAKSCHALVEFVFVICFLHCLTKHRQLMQDIPVDLMKAGSSDFIFAARIQH